MEYNIKFIDFKYGGLLGPTIVMLSFSLHHIDG